MDILFSRQAVFDRKKDVYGYELLFDKDDEQYNKDLEESRVKFICNMGTIGLSQFTNNKRIFMNLTNISLLERIPDLLGNDNIIIQLTNRITFDENTLSYLKELREKHYIITYKILKLDDRLDEVIHLLDIIKIDYSKYPKDEFNMLIMRIKKLNLNVKLLASNICDDEAYKSVLDSGFDYFEGEYFSKPTIISSKNISVRNSNKFYIIIELLNDRFDIDRIEYIIKSDLSISYKLIRFLNSPVFGFTENINSIRQAIMLLGKEELKRWLTLVVVSEFKNEENEELLKNTIIRARFCELVAEKVIHSKKSSAFMVGLFSELSYYMDKSMENLLQEINIETEVKKALMGDENILKDVLDLVKAYEKMEVKTVEKYSQKIKIDKKILFDIYSQAIDWLNETNIILNK